MAGISISSTVRNILRYVKLFMLAPIRTKSPGPSLSGLFNKEFRCLLHFCLAIALLSLATCHFYLRIHFWEYYTMYFDCMQSYLSPYLLSDSLHCLPGHNSMSPIQCNNSVADSCYSSAPGCEAIHPDQRMDDQWPSLKKTGWLSPEVITSPELLSYGREIMIPFPFKARYLLP